MVHLINNTGRRLIQYCFDLYDLSLFRTQDMINIDVV